MLSDNPLHLARSVETLINSLNFPDSNHELAEAVRRLYIHQTVSGVADRYKRSADEIKIAFEHKLADPMEPATLLVTSGVTLGAKVTKPRESFDKDAFIKAVAEEYNLAPLALHKLADKCVKKSKPPVSFFTAYKDSTSVE